MAGFSTPPTPASVRKFNLWRIQLISNLNRNCVFDKSQPLLRGLDVFLEKGNIVREDLQVTREVLEVLSLMRAHVRPCTAISRCLLPLRDSDP